MQRYFVKSKKDNYLELDSSDIHHIKNVMRNKQGDKIECIYNKNLYICEVVELGSKWVSILKEEKIDNSNNKKLCIGVSLVKEQKIDLILQKLTELGVDEIIPLKMERSIVKLDSERIEKKLNRWNKICKEASEQSKRNYIPNIRNPMTLKELVNTSYDVKFICSTSDSKRLDYDYLNSFKDKDKMIFIIGPEGGISKEEENFLKDYGYIPVSLGKEIMRVETAAIYVASIINFMK